jgi:3-isopropylmalate/(R)-2-methylmalate dehydratase small subunit
MFSHQNHHNTGHQIKNFIMKAFKNISSTAVPLPMENIDTDQIIPARFLKATTREGFGENLFRDWRYQSDGRPNENFVFNNPRYSGQILVTGKNFGCGSSREHAAWAIYDAGFRVVVSSYFADIFKGNALNTGLLPVVVSPAFLNGLFSSIEKNPNSIFTVDLAAQFIKNDESGEVFSFDIDGYKKLCLMEGLDDTDYVLTQMERIKAFEQTQVIF